MGTRILLAVVLFLPLVLNGEPNMPGGTDSTLTINPDGKASLTIATDTAQVYDGTTPYLVPLQTLDFNEDARERVVYDENVQGEGGRDILVRHNLVPVTFWVIIKSQTRAGVIDAYGDLQEALTNSTGGTIAYKPDGVGAGVLTTYYHYVRSSPPELVKRKRNRWDAPQTKDGYFTLMVGASFMTQPIATSDPSSPVTLSDLAATVENWYDATEGQINEVTVSGSNLKGTLPALVRLNVRPGSGQVLGRLVVFKRDEETITNFASVYEAEDADPIYPSSAWFEVSDSARGDDNYMRCFPAPEANGVAQGLRFTISNPSDHRGRFAVFGVGYEETDFVESTGLWTHQAKVKVGNIIQEGKSTWYASSFQNWQLVYVGEFELPPTPMSEAVTSYDAGPFVEWYSTRVSGSSAFRLDAIILVYVSDSDLSPTALDVPCGDERGVTNDEKLVVENFLDARGQVRELAQVLDYSSSAFMRALMEAPRGDFLMLAPDKDTLLVFVQEQWNGVILDDDFESYKGHRWMPIESFETLTGWSVTNVTVTPTNHVEDEYCFRFQGSMSDAQSIGDRGLDLESEGRFTDGDFSCIRVYFGVAPGGSDLFVTRFVTQQPDDYYHNDWNGMAQNNFLFAKKSDYSGFGAADWADIAQLHIYSSPVSDYFYVDYWRLEKADPDDSNNPNATGNQWDFQPVGGAWTITEDVTGDTLACLDDEAAVEKAALIDETTPGDVRFRARVLAKDSDGAVGIIWRAGQDTLTEGAEDCYAALLNTGTNQLLCREYNNGAYTAKDSPSFTSVPDTWYTLGVIAKGSEFRVYAVASASLTDDDDLFDNQYLRSTFTDTTHTSGQCGVMSFTTLGRFDAAKLWSLQDKVVPADTIALTGQALFRTIAPFSE